MDRQQYAHLGANPSDYGAVDYAPSQQQMMYSMGPGQQVVGPPLVSVQGVPPPHAWPSETHVRHPAGHSPSLSGARGHAEPSSGNGAEMLEELLGPFPVVRLRGLPFEAQVRDVILFFQGIGVLDVVMMNKGECMVLFNTVTDTQLALGRDRQNMGRRYIEIFMAKRFDYYNAIAQSWEDGRHRRPHHHRHPHAFAERMPGGEREGMYHEYHAAQQQHHHHHHHQQQQQHHQQHPHVHHPPQHPLQQALQMSQHQQQQYNVPSTHGHGHNHNHAGHNQHHAAAHHQHHHNNANNNTSSSSSNSTTTSSSNNNNNAPQGQTAATPGVSREAAIAATERAQNSGILKLRGLPFTSTKPDVQLFFEEFNVQLDNIHVVLRADGRMTGEAFVSFASAEEARSAQEAKDRSTLGSRYVELFNTTPEELARAMVGQQYQQQVTGPGATAAGNSGSSVVTSSSASSETTESTSSISSGGSISSNGAVLKGDDKDLASAAADVAVLTA